jgi:hypothetical protein
MLDIIMHMVDTVAPLSPFLMPPIWIALIAYGTWYFTSARRHAPLTKEEVRVLWKIHKQDAQCNCRKLQEIKRRGKVVGFKCGCGYIHKQERPMI